MRTSVLLAILTCLGAQVAQARERAVVMTAGAEPAEAARAVERALSARFDLVPPQEVVAALKDTGYTADDLRRAATGGGDLLPGLRDALAGLPLSAFAFVDGGRPSARVILLEISRGTRALDATFRPARRTRRLDTRRVESAVRGALARVPAAPAPVAAAKAEESGGGPASAAAGRESPPGEGPVRVRGRLLLGMGGRQFSFHQPISRGLRDYSLLATPSVAAELEGFPLRGEILGLLGSVSFAPGVRSTADDTGEAIESAWLEWQAGARLKLHVGAVDLGASLSYGQLGFTFSGGSLAGDLPGVRYAYGRGALALWWPLGPTWQLHAEVGVRRLFAIGPLEDRFPHDEAGGVDGKLGFTYAITRSFGALVETRYAHQYHAFHPVPGDANVAGGALDLFPALYLGLQYAR